LKLRISVTVFETGIAEKRVLSHDQIIGISPATGRTRHGHRLGSITQGIHCKDEFGKFGAGDGAAVGVGIHWSSRSHDLFGGGGEHRVRIHSSWATHAVSGTPALAESRFQRSVASGLVVLRIHAGAIPFHRRRLTGQSGGGQNAEHLQHRQPQPPVEEEGPALRPEKDRGQEMSQLHVWVAHHAVGISRPV
jgi:hypothetical protein